MILQAKKPRSAPGADLLGSASVLKYAVHDLKAWLDHLTKLGVGPWWISVDQAPEAFVYNGKQSDARFTWGLTWSGDVMLELIQPLDGNPSPYKLFLDRGREGLHHAAYYPGDYDATVETLKGQGKKEILRGHSGGARFVYFEGLGVPPEPIELQELPKELIEKQETLRRIANTWKGDEPFRGPSRSWW